MIRLTIESSTYAFEVEFRHVRGRALGRRSAIAAITTCVIVAQRQAALEPHTIQFAAIGNAVCARGDNFSRRVGRTRAFKKAVEQCGMLYQSRIALLEAYMYYDPPRLPREREVLTEAQKKERWEAGWEKRKAREIARGAGGGR